MRQISLLLFPFACAVSEEFSFCDTPPNRDGRRIERALPYFQPIAQKEGFVLLSRTNRWGQDFQNIKLQGRKKKKGKKKYAYCRIEKKKIHPPLLP
jgi:hypothetical protein